MPYKSRNGAKGMAPESVANITSASLRQGSANEEAGYNNHPAWQMNEPESTNDDYHQNQKEMFNGGKRNKQSNHTSQIQTPTLAQSVAGGEALGTAPQSDENDE